MKNQAILSDMRVSDILVNAHGYARLLMEPEEGRLPEILPGQFVNVLVPGTDRAFLRRPISVNDVDYERNRLSLLVKDAGAATHRLCDSRPGDTYNILLPLGHGFRLPDSRDASVLLVGGGVGTAPMLYLGRCLAAKGIRPRFLLGARTAEELMQLEDFRAFGEVVMATEDGSLGVKGFVTAAAEMEESYDMMYVCGPLPMMKAVAATARRTGTPCQVSLENKMACGLGACLCCVEDTKRGNECTCTAGPVFDINDLKW